MFGNGSSAFETASHELHRVRRAAFASFLSKASVQRLEPVVQSVVEKLVSRLEAVRGSGTTINALHLYSALTGDIINQYAFARSHNYLDQQEFAKESYIAWMHITANCHLLQHFGFMATVMRTMPDWLVQLMAPDLKVLNDLQKVDSWES